MAKPVYQIVKDRLIEEIEDAAPNTPIMSERELADQFEVSRMTARRAIQELVQEGYLYTNKNKGTFVADAKLRKTHTPGDTLEGYDSYKVMHFNMKTPPKQVAKRLEIKEMETCIRLIRVNMRNKQPVSIDEFYINTKYISDTGLEAVKFLERFVESVDEMVVKKEFRAIIIPTQYAKLLDMELNVPIIKTETTYLSVQGKPYIFSNTYNHPDRMRIRVTA